MGITRLSIYVLLLFFDVIHGDDDTISINKSLSGNQTIVSSRGIFKLGFFSPGNSSNYYIGIWYSKVPKQTIVWVANREKPVSDIYSSDFRISDGNIFLFNEFKVPIWSSDLKLNDSSSSSVKAVLLDEGNLVLQDGSGLVIWQSFDHPTDTWLPGNKVGYNKMTRSSTFLVSWRNREDPAPGLFSFGLDLSQRSQYTLRWNMSPQSWSSGPWNGQMFSFIPEILLLNSTFNFSFSDNALESYFTYYTLNDSVLSRFVMDVSGMINQLVWIEPNQEWSLFWSQPSTPCDFYGYCGPYGSCAATSKPFCRCLTGFYPKSVNDYELENYSKGCFRRTRLQCEKSSLVNKTNEDRFYKSYSLLLPDNAQAVAVGNADDCKSSCLRACSCTAYAYNNQQCLNWHGDLLNLRQIAESEAGGSKIYIKIAASELKNSSNDRVVLSIGIAVGVFGAVLLVGLVVAVVIRRRTKGSRKMNKVINGSLVAFRFRDLRKATKNFSERLGVGGFGSVYKGKLPDSSFIAVKKLQSIYQGEKQFRSEVSIIGTMQHLNLVRLRGFCSRGTHKLLVYDYMPNGSLESHLFNRTVSTVLDWKSRYQIAVGTARGLAYLHEKCREHVVHCDIKPDNILLDADFCPKVADFGMAKLFGRDFSRVLTTMRGTIGYLAPEWISGVAITPKADVYSYGMMLFEIVSGRRNSEKPKHEQTEYFPIKVAILVNEDGNVLDLLDSKLEHNADVLELKRICKVACWCIQYDEAKRPSMSQVIHILEGVVDVSLPPVPSYLQALNSDYNTPLHSHTRNGSSSGV